MALRFERLDFNPWGCFENHSLRFSPRAGDVDLVHGRNASGKSTTSRGERSLLYGIDERTVDNHTYDYADLKIGARLNVDGRTIEVSRRKRRVDSLLGPNGETVPEDLLRKALGGLSADVYIGLLQVDNETLVRGGEELLQGQGEVGASLFAAAAGIASLHRTLADLQAEADRLFNPRGRSTVLHKQLAELREVERRLRETTLRPARHSEMTRALSEDERACEEAMSRLRELDLEMRELERKRAIAPLLAVRAELVEEYAGLEGTPDLPGDAAARRLDVQGRIRSATLSLERAAKALAALDGEICAITVESALLARGEEIRAVAATGGAINKAAGDRRKREGELQAARVAVSHAAATVGVDASEIESLRRPIAARNALDVCLRAGDELRTALRVATTTHDLAVWDRDDAQAALTAAPSASGIAPLEAALAAALKSSAVCEQREELDLEAKRSRREADEKLGELVPAPASVAALRLIAAPSRAEATRAVAQVQELRRETEALEADLQRLAVDETEVEEERLRLQVEGEAPSAEVLAGARSRRDERWSRIRAAGAEGELTADNCGAFERVMAEADHLADRRTDHAAQIGRTAALHARAAKLTRDRADYERRQDVLRDREAADAAAWAATWSTTQLDATEPDDALAWLDAREEVIALVRAADAAEERADRLCERERELVDLLVAELHLLGLEVVADAPLEAVIARTQRAVSDARAAAATRASLETTFDGAERALARAKRELDKASSAFDKWEKAWPQRRADAGLPETTSPDAAHEIARAIDEGLSQLATAANLERRIAGIDADTDDFDLTVTALCNDLVPDLQALATVRAAATLGTRLTEQESAKARRDGLLEQRTTQADELAVLESELANAEAEIAELVELAGVTDAREVPVVEARAERVRALRQEIEAAELRVAEVGEGRFAELAASAEGFDRDRAAIELDELRATADELRVERDEIRERIGERRRGLVDAETDASAVEAAQDVALARAAVLETAVAHAKANLAAATVRRAIERYRVQHQDPLLRRANELFTRFTLGSFVELFVDVNERGTGELIGRQRDRVLKRVPQMSKGTREQLFLALRIAAIERYVASSGPVPVIFDDVFVESDSPRSERIFDALGELATLTQVIVLTHHEHLIDVGRKALGDRLVAQDLPDAAPTLREAAAA
jgi:uncharacterized protein YhaN